MAPRVDLPFNDYFNLENVEENYNFIETESDLESEYDRSESESELEPNEGEEILYEITFLNGVRKTFVSIENIHSRDVVECDAFLADVNSEDYEEEKFNSAITMNGNALSIH